MAKLEASLTEMLTPAVEALGFELLGVEYLSAGKHSTLRVYIDSPAGITVDDCADVSRQVSAVLDVEDPIRTEYNLEVSSPGVERPLFKPHHYQAVVGQEISVRTNLPIEGRRKFKGLLDSADDQQITMIVDGKPVPLMIDNIEKANLVAAF